MFQIIQNMYKNNKSNIVYNNDKSEFFPCDNGVRQVENMSPYLFALFLKDLENFMENKNSTDLNTITEDIDTTLGLCIKLFALLYADDTVLMSELPEELQRELNRFHEYCTTWKLKVDVEKTKILCFASGRLPNNLYFRYDNRDIEIVEEFNYLGILLNRTGNFNLAIKA